MPPTLSTLLNVSGLERHWHTSTQGLKDIQADNDAADAPWGSCRGCLGLLVLVHGVWSGPAAQCNVVSIPGSRVIA